MAGYDFDAVVIGGGAAGLTAAGLAANFGAKTALIEAGRLGGDCTWTGCVPSKTLIKAGKVAHYIRKAGRYGLMDTTPQIDPVQIMRHVHSVRKKIYEAADRPEIYENMGIEVIRGKARFLNSRSLHLDLNNDTTRKVTSRYFFICAGGHASVPSIKGLDQIPYLTSESLFELNSLPEELIILGGGNIGTEMAQALNRLGTKVTVIESSARILPHDDPELAEIALNILKSEGVNYLLNAEVTKAEPENGHINIYAAMDGGEEITMAGEALLIAAGRSANLEELGLDAAGVKHSKKGVEVNDCCRTNVRHIYACGDITGEYRFTHMSDHMAKVAVTSALLKYPMKIDHAHVPWCTYTSPELGHVGATEEQLKEQGTSYRVYRFPYSMIDRAVTDSEEEGLIKIFARKWSGKILGADVLGARAGEVISEYAVAMKNGVTLRNIADTIHPYPAYGLGARRAADQWYIQNQAAWQVKLVKKIFGYRGEVPDYSEQDRIV